MKKMIFPLTIFTIFFTALSCSDDNENLKIENAALKKLLANQGGSNSTTTVTQTQTSTVTTSSTASSSGTSSETTTTTSTVTDSSRE